MGDKTGIGWTDATWNFVTGCDPVSRGCDHCYAESIATRFAGTPAYPNGFAVTPRPERLNIPLKWTRPRMIFTNSMSDIFHDEVDDDLIARAFAVMAVTPRHTYQVLTKRHARMRSLLRNSGWWAHVVIYALELEGTPGFEQVQPPQTRAGGLCALPNVWLGVSVEDQKWADIRIPALLETPAARRFLSCEPLLGPVDLAAATTGKATLDGPDVDWVIAGGESGPGARPLHPDWVRSLRDQCATRPQTRFFFKQWGSHSPEPVEGRDPVHVHVDGSGSGVTAIGTAAGTAAGTAGTAPMWSTNAKAAGNVLDGSTWEEFPTPFELPA